MFYSPKGNREAFTEPHSKAVSVAHTKENSPIRGADGANSFVHHVPQVQH